MKIALITLLFAAPAFAQAPPAASPVACGKENVSFKVKLEESHHAFVPPDPGKAQVYFFQDAGSSHNLGAPTVKIAMDGAWAGANHGNSYFSVSVEPGEHHVCVNVQSSLLGQRVELAHFTAEAEQVYYYRTRLILSRSVEMLELEPIDSDQAKYLIATYPLSMASPKK